MAEQPKPVVIEGIPAAFHPNMVKTWGEETIREIVELFDEPIHEELQQVVFDTELTPEEQTIYLETSPHIHRVRTRLLAIEEKIAQAMLPKFEKSLKHLIPKLGTPQEKQALTEFALFFEFPNILRQFFQRDFQMKNARVMEMVSGLMQRMIFTMDLYCAERKIPVPMVRQLQGFISGMMGHLSHLNQVNYAENNLKVFVGRNNWVIHHNRPAFDAFVQGLPSEVDSASLEEDILEVEDLLTTRRQSFTESGSVPPFVFIPEPPDLPVRRCFGVVEGAVLLGEGSYNPPKTRPEGGFSYSANENALEFTVDRSMHELCVPLTHHSYEYVFHPDPSLQKQSAQLYLRIKAAFYKALLTFLRQLPEDRKPIQSEEPAEVVEAVREELDGQLPDLIPATEGTFHPEITELPQEKRISFPECRGLSGNEVKALLLGILGEPLRIVGSHHVFIGPTGKKLPIALHGSAKTDPRALRANIEAWGVTSAWRKARGS